jgi:hypothetical protein
MGLPTWDGTQIVCNQTVSFSPAATAPLPEFAADERLGLCARTMHYLDLHRQYGGQTSYFAVAAETTATLAATYAPLVRRAYSDGTWAFMADLSRSLEPRVDAVAEQAASGPGLFGRIVTARPDTRALIRAEQEAVQAELDRFARENPEGYAQLIKDVNGTFNPTNPLLLAAINRNPFYRAYEAGLAQVRARHGGAIDFADMEQRIEIGGVSQALVEAIPAQ